MVPPPHRSSPPLEVRPGVWLDSRRGLYFAAMGLLAVADVHWGYAESHRRRGNLVPLWGDDEIESRLTGLLSDFQPKEMLWLGDSLHTLAGKTRAEQFLRQSPVPVTVIAGNHDAAWDAAETRFRNCGDFCFHHGDRNDLPVAPGLIEVVGHHHPSFLWTDGAGGRVKLPLLVACARRLVLPAFSPWAAGAPWKRSSADEVWWAVTPRKIFAIPPSFDSARVQAL